jgi:ribonucleotide monophosphatase NagD (HAD superfamily)
MAQAKGNEIERNRILAIGDAVRTDLLGAARLGIESLFVLGGIHAAEVEDSGAADLVSKLASVQVKPLARQTQLTW